MSKRASHMAALTIAAAAAATVPMGRPSGRLRSEGRPVEDWIFAEYYDPKRKADKRARQRPPFNRTQETERRRRQIGGQNAAG